MGFFDGIVDLVTGDKSKKEAAKSLSFADAIAAHMKWIERLENAISGTSTEIDTLDPAVISCDDKCVLGKWIYGVAYPKFKSNGNFKHLVASHAQFHKHAGVIVTNVKIGRRGYANAVLKGSFTEESKNVVGSLQAMEMKYRTPEAVEEPVTE